MDKDPAVLFYTSDFLTGTSRFSDEQCGQYIRALCSQHQEGMFTKDELFQILKSYDSPVWKKFKQCDDGLFYNERMQKEIEKRVSYCESKSHPGVSGRKPKSYDNHMNTVRKSYANHTDNDNDNDNDTEYLNDNKKDSVDTSTVNLPTDGGDGKKKKIPEWKNKCTTFELYQKWELKEYTTIIDDRVWLKERDEFHRDLDILLSLKKAHVDFWSQHRGWKNIKVRRGETVDWKATWVNALTVKCNQVKKDWNTRQKDEEKRLLEKQKEIQKKETEAPPIEERYSEEDAAAALNIVNNLVGKYTIKP